MIRSRLHSMRTKPESSFASSLEYRCGQESVAALARLRARRSTGAGDAFAGAYLARLAQGLDRPSARSDGCRMELSDGCRMESAAVQSFGADFLIRTYKK